MTLVEFLLARIADDEAAQQYLFHTAWHSGDCDLFTYDAVHTCNLPARVVAECEAKRRIVASECRWAGPLVEATWCYGCGRPIDECSLLRELAAVYADHPDYDEAWRPAR